MKRKRIAIVLCVMFSVFCSGCGANMENSAAEQKNETESADYRDTEDLNDTEQKSEIESADNQDTEAVNDVEQKSETEGADNQDIEAVNGTEQKNETESAEHQDTEVVNDTEQNNETESIQDEIAKIEIQSVEYENADWSSMGQQDMNQLTAQWYQLWDDELNSLWSRLSDELDTETKAKVLDEQRAWVTRKDENIKGAGAAAYGGSLQAQLENSTAEEMTRARAYILAGYLADVRNESFTISSEIQKSIDMADPSLDDVFKKFEGQWTFDVKSCVAIEKTEMSAYGVPGSEWTVWVTGGDIISDLDVYGYTENSIVFRTVHDDVESFYILSFNVENALTYEYGTSLAAMDGIIVCSE
jgi:uncharacterized protein YecT (DUF1311 family)